MCNILSLLGTDSTVTTIRGQVINAFHLKEIGNVKEIRSFLGKNKGIYCWVNERNNKIYIGSSNNLWKRFLSYKRFFFYKKTQRINKKIINETQKNGYNHLKFYILELFTGPDKELRDLEQKYLDLYEPFNKFGYNINRKISFYPSKTFTQDFIQRIKDANTGENSSNAILNNEKVFKIKERLAKGEKLKTLASEFNVSTTVISNIKRGLTWAHIKIDENTQACIDSLISKHKRKNISHDIIKAIKTDISSGMKMTEIAKKYNLGYTCISGLKYGNIYKDIIP